MSAVKLKLTVNGQGNLTVTEAQEALGKLRRLGAPAEAQVVIQTGAAGWAMFVQWEPEDPADGPPEFDPVETASRIQRRLLANPQT